MDFLDFLHLDVTQESSNKAIMDYVLNSFNGLDVNDYNTNSISFNSTIKKFISLLNYSGLSEYEDELISHVEYLTDGMRNLQYLKANDGDESAIKNRLNQCNRAYTGLFDKLTEAYILLRQGPFKEDPFSSFKKLYTPNFSNKAIAISLIEEAARLIESDKLLPENAKKQILKRLDKILKSLRSEKTNWIFYYGAMKETIIILAALVTIGGSIYTLDHFFDAKNKLEEAAKVIETTSINNNYITYESTDNYYLYQGDGIQKLPENTDEKSKD